MKKTFKILLVVLMCMAFATVCLAAPSAVAGFDTAMENEDDISSNVTLSSEIQGEGTQASPYVITSAEEFNAAANLVNAGDVSYCSAYYVLGNNIDFTDKKLVPFGTVIFNESDLTSNVPFMGHIDGNGYGIYGVDVDDVLSFSVIGCMSQGSVKNLSVSYNVTDRSLSVLSVFGGIVGYAETDTLNSIEISNCEASGTIKFDATNSAGVYVGGIVGRVEAIRANIVFDSCASYCDIDVTATSGSTAGGFAGYVRASSSMCFRFTTCLAYGDVSLCSSGNRNMCGGFVGFVYKDEDGWVEASLSGTDYHFYKSISYGDVYTSCNRTARIGGFAGKVENPTVVTFYGNQRHMNQSVEGSAKYIELCEMVNNTYADELYDKTFLSESMAYDVDNIWYYNSLDKRLYHRATAKKNDAASLRDGASIRLSTNKSGLRFTADIEMFKRDYVAEYGFILSTEKNLGESELTFDFGGKYVSGVAYDGTTDVFYDKTDENIVFTGVLYNIPSSAYQQKVVARTYVKYVSNGVTYTVYGNTVSASLYEIASAIKNDESVYEALGEAQKQVFDEMFPSL